MNQPENSFKNQASLDLVKLANTYTLLEGNIAKDIYYRIKIRDIPLKEAVAEILQGIALGIGNECRHYDSQDLEEWYNREFN